MDIKKDRTFKNQTVLQKNKNSKKNQVSSKTAPKTLRSVRSHQNVLSPVSEKDALLETATINVNELRNIDTLDRYESEIKEKMMDDSNMKYKFLDHERNDNHRPLSDFTKDFIKMGKEDNTFICKSLTKRSYKNDYPRDPRDPWNHSVESVEVKRDKALRNKAFNISDVSSDSKKDIHPVHLYINLKRPITTTQPSNSLKNKKEVKTINKMPVSLGASKNTDETPIKKRSESSDNGINPVKTPSILELPQSTNTDSVGDRQLEFNTVYKSSEKKTNQKAYDVDSLQNSELIKTLDY